MTVPMKPISAPSLAFRWPALDRRFLLWGFVLPLAFDFMKFENAGGATIQVVLLGLTLTSGGLYVLLEVKSPNLRVWSHRSTLHRITLIWWFYLVLTPLPVFVWGVNIEHYLKILLPFILFGIALAVMCSIERRNIDPFVVLKMLLWAGLFGAIWRVGYGIGTSGLSLDSIRWQILSPSLPLLIGFGAAGLYLKERTFLSFLVLLLGICIAVLSVTRSYLISLLLIFASILAIDLRRRSLLSATRQCAKMGFGAIVIIFIGCSVATYFRPNIFQTWVGRLTLHSTDSGLDITLITRLAEFKWQWVALTQNMITALIGNGIGSDYQRDQAILNMLPFVSEHDLDWFSGHSTWVYQFFSSGFVLGAIVPLFLIIGLKYGYIAATKRSIHTASVGPVTAFVILTSYLGQSFTSNLLGQRYAGLIFGVVLGSVFLYRRRVPDVSAYRTT